MLILWPPIIDLSPITIVSTSPTLSSRPTTPPSPVFEATIPSQGLEAVAHSIQEDSTTVDEGSVGGQSEAQTPDTRSSIIEAERRADSVEGVADAQAEQAQNTSLEPNLVEDEEPIEGYSEPQELNARNSTEEGAVILNQELINAPSGAQEQELGHILKEQTTKAARPLIEDQREETEPVTIEAMAANLPAKLNTPDLRPFIQRAAQLEKVKPVVAYWCEYWIVQQILTKGLHNGDAECLQYTTNLMNKLEETKAENSSNDAIIDDTAGQAYVEQFALETFLRADRTVQANKVTKQTADTFQASATFFELINIWGPLDAETQSKVKYAKFHAIRILRALKAGQDPNESNPKPEPAQEDLPALDPNDPEVAALGGPSQPRKASVEEVPDEQDTVEARLARQSTLDRSLHPSAQVSARASPGPSPMAKEFDPYPRNGFPYSAVKDDQVSPLEPSPQDDARHGSVGGGYFPEIPGEAPGEIPTFTSESQDSSLKTAPPAVMDLGLPDTSTLSPPGSQATAPEFSPFQSPAGDNQSSTPPPQDYYRQVPPSAPQQHFPPPPSNPQPHFPPPPSAPQQHFPPPPTQPTYQPPIQPYNPPSASTPAAASPAIPRNGPLNKDDASIAKAQKHAKWAISALNFDDAETAVKELRLALQTLGAQ